MKDSTKNIIQLGVILFIAVLGYLLVMIQAKMYKESGFECIVSVEPDHVYLPYYKLSFGLKSSVSSLPA